MIESLWTITFDPSGTPLTLAAEGSDWLAEELPQGGEQEVETVAFIEGEMAEHYPRERKRAGLVLEVIKQHASQAAAYQHQLDQHAAIPWTTRAPLRAASTALGLTKQMANAVIQSCQIEVIRGGFRTRATYTLVGQPFALYTP